MTGSIKTMLLGIAILLIGIYIQGDPGIRGDFDLFFVVLGFIITLAGFLNKTKPNN